MGQKVRFVVIRNKVQTDVTVTTVESNVQSDVPVVGITLATGYRYDPEISFDLGQQIGGPSAGLVFALAIYDKITDGPLLAGRHFAGTGTITPEGDVQAIGGIQEKISAAQKAGATAFFVPASNCRDLDGVRTTMTLIKIATLERGHQGRPGSQQRRRHALYFRTADEPSCQPGRSWDSELPAEHAHTLT